jgi:hypothetical protein
MSFHLLALYRSGFVSPKDKYKLLESKKVGQNYFGFYFILGARRCCGVGRGG